METRAGDSSQENQHHGEVPGSSKSDSSPSGSAVDEAETRVSLQGRLSVQESLELLGKETSPGEYGSSRQCTTATDEDWHRIGTALEGLRTFNLRATPAHSARFSKLTTDCDIWAWKQTQDAESKAFLRKMRARARSEFVSVNQHEECVPEPAELPHGRKRIRKRRERASGTAQWVVGLARGIYNSSLSRPENKSPSKHLWKISRRNQNSFARVRANETLALEKLVAKNKMKGKVRQEAALRFAKRSIRRRDLPTSTFSCTK